MTANFRHISPNAQAVRSMDANANHGQDANQDDGHYWTMQDDGGLFAPSPRIPDPEQEQGPDQGFAPLDQHAQPPQPAPQPAHVILPPIVPRKELKTQEDVIKAHHETDTAVAILEQTVDRALQANTKISNAMIELQPHMQTLTTTLAGLIHITTKHGIVLQSTEARLSALESAQVAAQASKRKLVEPPGKPTQPKRRAAQDEAGPAGQAAGPAGQAAGPAGQTAAIASGLLEILYQLFVRPSSEVSNFLMFFRVVQNYLVINMETDSKDKPKNKHKFLDLLSRILTHLTGTKITASRSWKMIKDLNRCVCSVALVLVIANMMLAGLTRSLNSNRSLLELTNACWSCLG